MRRSALIYAACKGAKYKVLKDTYDPVLSSAPLHILSAAHGLRECFVLKIDEAVVVIIRTISAGDTLTIACTVNSG